jgi:hypothetical protein
MFQVVSCTNTGLSTILLVHRGGHGKAELAKDARQQTRTQNPNGAKAMMTLELDDDTARLLHQLMEREHTGAVQLVRQALADYLGAKQTEQPPELMADIISTLPNLSTFAGDPLTIQQAMRDEWR